VFSTILLPTSASPFSLTVSLAYSCFSQVMMIQEVGGKSIQVNRDIVDVRRHIIQNVMGT